MLAVALAARSFAAPVIPDYEIVAGDPDGGTVVFPITAPDGGARHSIRLRSTGNIPLVIDAISITGDDANVFEVEGLVPAQLLFGNEREYTFHFKPFNQTGTYTGRVVIDWNDTHRDEHLILCGTSGAVDGGMGACVAPPSAGARIIATRMPTGGCSAAPVLALGAALALFVRRRVQR